MTTHAILYERFTECSDISIDVVPMPEWINPSENYGVFEEKSANKKIRKIRLERHDLSGQLLKKGSRYSGSFLANSNSIIPIQSLVKSCLSFVCEDRGDILLHASAVMRKGKLWLFSGPSGSGKSTIAERLSGGGMLFSLDHVVLTSRESNVVVYTTPFSDNDHMVCPCVADNLAAVTFIEQAKSPAIIELSPHSLVKRFLSQSVAHSRAAETLNRTLGTISEIINQIDCFILKFPLDEGFWDLLDNRAAGIALPKELRI